MDAASARRDHRSARSKLNILLRELSDDESEAENDSDGDIGIRTRATNDPKDSAMDKPWLKKFNEYLREMEDIGSNSIVRWWRVSEMYSDHPLSLIVCDSSTQIVILCGHRLHSTTS